MKLRKAVEEAIKGGEGSGRKGHTTPPKLGIGSPVSTEHAPAHMAQYGKTWLTHPLAAHPDVAGARHMDEKAKQKMAVEYAKRLTIAKLRRAQETTGMAQQDAWTKHQELKDTEHAQRIKDEHADISAHQEVLDRAVDHRAFVMGRKQ